MTGTKHIRDKGASAMVNKIMTEEIDSKEEEATKGMIGTEIIIEETVDHSAETDNRTRHDPGMTDRQTDSSTITETDYPGTDRTTETAGETIMKKTETNRETEIEAPAVSTTHLKEIIIDNKTKDNHTTDTSAEEDDSTEIDKTAKVETE
jgi:hypothetical protein